jgi:putative FmdB family regulatory protein
MPIYDYVCRGCNTQFELLVRAATTPACPECRGEDLERLLSVPGIRSDATRAAVKRETQSRDAAQAKDRSHEQLKYERSHND